MQIITTAVIKGGTGKTTTAAALAQAAAADGKKVLAIDLDPQANLSYSIGADQNTGGSYELLHGADPAQLIQHTAQGIDAIAASPDLATEQTKPASAKRLQEALEPIKKDYDYIIIDTPPTMGELTFNALQAATGLIIPLETDNSSLQGLYQITDIAHQMQRSNPHLTIKGVILSRYDARPKLNRYLREVIAEKGQEIGAPLLMGVRPGIAIREAQAMQQSIYEYAPKSNPAQDYKALYEMIQEG
jgi:chromosome partitioning protein